MEEDEWVVFISLFSLEVGIICCVFFCVGFFIFELLVVIVYVYVEYV